MPDPGFARPDLCSIRTAGGQEELAEAVRGGFSADGCPPGVCDPPPHPATRIDRALRPSTPAAVLALAGPAARVSLPHAPPRVPAPPRARNNPPPPPGP